MKKLALFFLLSFFILTPNNLSAENSSVLSSAILINQIMVGQNEGAKNEFIELYNPNNFNISLENYNLKKKTKGGTESNLISNRAFLGVIPAKGYFLISSPEFCEQINCDLKYSTSASLTKSNTAILYNPEKEVVDKIGYGEASDFWLKASIEPENNQVLKRINFNLTSKNNFSDFIIEQENIKIQNSRGDKIKIENQAEKIISETKTNTNKSKAEKIPLFLELWDIKNGYNKDLVITEGIVTVLPGALGSQFFYIHKQRKGERIIHGLQIYNYHKKFPELKTGDWVKINGELVVTEICQFGQKSCPENGASFYRLKTFEVSDIKIISRDNKINDPEVEKIRSFNLGQVSQLKTVSGEITQNKTNQIYLDDGDDEIFIEIKKGTEIAAKSLKEGAFFTISGIITQNSGQIRLSPLNQDQIKNNSENEVVPLGKVLDSNFWELEKNKENNTLLKYALISFFLIALYLIFSKKFS